MSTSAHDTAEARSTVDWPVDDWPVETRGATAYDGTVQLEAQSRVVGYDQPEAAGKESEPAWTHEAAAGAQGLSSGKVIALSAAAAAGCVLVDLWLTSGRLTFFFDLCFVVICLVTAMSVRRTDLFTVGVLPPLLFAAVIAVVSVTAPSAFESGPGVNKVFLTGIAAHAGGLVAAYVVTLLTVAARMAASRAAEPR